MRCNLGSDVSGGVYGETEIAERLAIRGVLAHTWGEFVVDNAINLQLTSGDHDRFDISRRSGKQAPHILAEQMGELWLSRQGGGGDEAERIGL